MPDRLPPRLLRFACNDTVNGCHCEERSDEAISRQPPRGRNHPFGFDDQPRWTLDELCRRFEKWAVVPNISDLIVRNGGSRMDSLGSLNAFVQAAEARSFTIAGRQTWRVVVGDRQGGGADGGTARRAPLPPNVFDRLG